MNRLRPAGFLLRGSAWVIDQLILGGLWALLAAWGLTTWLSWSRGPENLLGLGVLAGLLLLWGLLLHGVYFTVFVGGCGQTPGKMLCGIAVVRRDSSPVGYGRALLRWVGYALAALPFGLGLLGILFTAERRGLHDRIAGTRVVRCRAERAVDLYLNLAEG